MTWVCGRSLAAIVGSNPAAIWTLVKVSRLRLFRHLHQD